MALTLDNGWWVAPSGNYPGTSKPITSVGRCMAIGYGRTNPRTYHTSDPHWFTWQTGNSWNRAGLCILFINTTDQDIKLTSAKIKWSAFIYKCAEKYFVFENTGELNGPLDVWISKIKLMLGGVANGCFKCNSFSRKTST